MSSKNILKCIMNELCIKQKRTLKKLMYSYPCFYAGVNSILQGLSVIDTRDVKLIMNWAPFQKQCQNWRRFLNSRSGALCTKLNAATAS